jgi:hypothetical protein
VFRRNKDEPLLWIFGSPRSGSTWLLKMLAESPDVAPFDEPLIGLHLGHFVCDHPGAVAEDLDETNCTFSRVAKDAKGYFFAEQFADVWAEPLGRLIRARFQAQAAGRPVVAIKEPNGSQAADLILRAVPESRLLFLLRDGRDVVDSEVAAYSRGSWMSRRYPLRGIEPGQREPFLKEAAHKWVWQTRIVNAAFEQHAADKLLVRYEELRSDPDAQMQRVFGWLGLDIDADAAVASHAFETEAVRGPREFVRSAEPGAWRENLSVGEQALVNEIMGPTLREMGN